MSRTDKTRPFWVKVMDSKSNYREVHNHASRPLRDEKGKLVRIPTGEFFSNGYPKERIVEVPFTECDLPDDPRKDRGHWDGCHWSETRTWANSGEARCGCFSCSDQVWRRQENRKERRAGKAEAQNWEKWY